MTTSHLESFVAYLIDNPVFMNYETYKLARDLQKQKGLADMNRRVLQTLDKQAMRASNAAFASGSTMNQRILQTLDKQATRASGSTCNVQSLFFFAQILLMVVAAYYVIRNLVARARARNQQARNLQALEALRQVYTRVYGIAPRKFTSIPEETKWIQDRVEIRLGDLSLYAMQAKRLTNSSDWPRLFKANLNNSSVDSIRKTLSFYKSPEHKREVEDRLKCKALWATQNLPKDVQEIVIRLMKKSIANHAR
jgi:hypothetical protein